MQNLTAVVPYYNGEQHIDNLLATLPENLPVVIVDDHSDQSPLWLVDRYPERSIRVFRPETKGYFAGAVNAGIEATSTDVLVLNQDVSFDGRASSLMSLIEEERSRHSTIGDGVFGHPAWPNGYVQGTCMFMRRDAIEKVGLFEGTRFPLWGCTAEWQVRVCRAGFSALPLHEVPGMNHAREQREYGDGITAVLDGADRKQRDLLIRTPPLVSIIVTSYNYGRYLEDAINSLVGGDTSLGYMPGQTVQAFEVIIVNDASHDETAEVAQALADPWKGIHYIELPPANHPDGMPNNGTPAANNAGIRASHGRYITILCADDMYDSKRLEMMLPTIEANPKAVVYDDMMNFAHGKYVRRRKMEEYDFERLIHRNQIHAGILFHRVAWRDVGEYPEIMRYGREDWAVNVALGVQGYCGVHVDYPGYLYRREEQGRTMRNATGEWRERFVKQMHALFPLIYSGERPMSCCGGSRRSRKPMLNTSKVVSKLGVAGTLGNDFTGKEGMVLLEYLGNSQGTQLWGGADNDKYEFGLSRKFGYVSANSATFMIRQHWNGNKPLFQIADPDMLAQRAGEQTVPVEAATAVNTSTAPELEPAPVEAATAVPEPEPTEEAVPDPAEWSVKGFQEWLGDNPQPVSILEKMIELETGGKNRKGVIDALGGAIKETVVVAPA